MNHLMSAGMGVLMTAGVLLSPAAAQALTYSHAMIDSYQRGDSVFHFDALDMQGQLAHTYGLSINEFEIAGEGNSPTRPITFEALAESSREEGLKTKVRLEMGSVSNNPLNTPVTTDASVFARATFADSYRAQNADGSDYVWAPDDTATLHLNISGTSSFNAQNSTREDDDYFVDTTLIVAVLKQGALQASYDEERELDDEEILHYYQWVLGDYLPVYEDSVPAQITLDDQGKATLDLGIATGDNFDLLIILMSNISVMTQADLVSIEQDFSHTVTFEILGPNSTDPNSPPSSSAVPEPAAMSLLAMGGVVVLGAMNRRRR